MTESFSLKNTTKGKLPRLPFAAMKDSVLGKNYELSLVFISEKESQKLNKLHRGKDKPANILSFPLSKHAGEIFISPAYAKREAPLFSRTFSNYLGFLFIHGLVHLKGFDHGSRMEHEEAKIRKEFGI
jgi:probable rRNA maturation factor